MATGFIGLDDAFPQATSFIGDGASEIRDIKTSLITAFPGVDGAIEKPTTYGTPGTTVPTAADFSQLFTDLDTVFNPGTGTETPGLKRGMIMMWTGDTSNASAISDLESAGWYLCDSQGRTINGVAIPNLQDKFVKSYGTDPVGSTGGAGNAGTATTSGTTVVGSNTPKSISKQVTLTSTNMPEHRHQISYATEGNSYPGDGSGQASSNTLISSATAGSSDHEYDLVGLPGVEANVFQTGKYGSPSPVPVDVTIDAVTFAHEHSISIGDIEPPYYVLAFICYCGT